MNNPPRRLVRSPYFAARHHAGRRRREKRYARRHPVDDSWSRADWWFVSAVAVSIACGVWALW